MGWEIYDALIEGIPDDVFVKDYGLGLNWSWLEAESGCGISYTLRGGSKRGGKRDLRGKSLRKAAELSKSWFFEDATIGVAALNAWYSQPDRIAAIPNSSVIYDHGPSIYNGVCPQFSEENSAEESQGSRYRADRKNEVDPFYAFEPEIRMQGGNAKVVVIGHFPHVEDIAEYASLTVLERNCSSELDTPDPACEYVIPDAEYVYMTGVTIINKTMPRLLELSQNAKIFMVGPSVIPSDAFLKNGVHSIGGRVVLDPEKVKFCCSSRESFGDALKSYLLRRTTEV